MTATLDVLQLPPYGTDEPRFALVISGYTGDPAALTGLNDAAKALGAEGALIFTEPIKVASSDGVPAVRHHIRHDIKGSWPGEHRFPDRFRG